MPSRAETILGEAGIEPADARRLVAASSDAEAFLPGDGEAAVLLRAASAARAEPELGARVEAALLDAVAARGGELGAVERAVFRHLGLERHLGPGDVPGNRPRRLRALLTCLDELDGAGTREAGRYRGRVLDTLGRFLQGVGQLGDARIAYERALVAKEAAGDDAGVALTHGSLGRLCLELGAFADARRYLERDLAWVERNAPEATHVRRQLATEIGVCQMEMGDFAAARAALGACLEEAREAGAAVGAAFAAAWLGRVLVRAGDAGAAAELADEVVGAVADAPLRGVPELRGLAFFLAAEVHAARDRIEDALAAFGEAKQAFDEARRVSPVVRAELLQSEAAVLERAGRDRDAILRLKEALRLVDATSAEGLRERLDGRLRERDENAWLLHGSGRFLGHDQIRFLLDEAGQGGFRGRDESVCVLFSDVRDFTSISEGLSPDRLVALLNRYLASMTRCIEHFGGMVDKFIGDAIMALFSLPSVREDDADRALDAAWYMQAELDRLNRALEADLPRLRAGIGLHHGPVVAGLIGSPQKRSYTVIGDAANTASRLEGMTKLLGAPVLATGALVRRLRAPERWVLVPLGRWSPKGRAAAVDVFHLAAEADGSAGARAHAERAGRSQDALALFASGAFEAAADAFATLRAETGAETGALGYARLGREASRLARDGAGDRWDGAVPLREK